MFDFFLMKGKASGKKKVTLKVFILSLLDKRVFLSQFFLLEFLTSL